MKTNETKIETRISANGAAIIYVNGERTSNEKAVEIAMENGLPYYSAKILTSEGNAISKEFVAIIAAYKWIRQQTKKNQNANDGSERIIRYGNEIVKVYEDSGRRTECNDAELQNYIDAVNAKEHIEIAYRNAQRFVNFYVEQHDLTVEQAEQIFAAVNADNADNKAVKEMIANFKSADTPAEAEQVADTPAEIAKFEVGKTYAAKKSVLTGLQFTITVLKRTPKFVTFQFDDDEEDIRKHKVAVEYGVEKIYIHETNALDGDYEFSANDIVDEPEAAATVAEIDAAEYAISEDENAVIENAGYDETVFELLPTVDELNDADTGLPLADGEVKYMGDAQAILVATFIDGTSEGKCFETADAAIAFARDCEKNSLVKRGYVMGDDKHYGNEVIYEFKRANATASGKSDVEIAEILTDILLEKISPWSPHMELTLQNGEKAISTPRTAIVKPNWHGEGFVFITPWDEIYARYDTPAQVAKVIGRLKACVVCKIPCFTFPTVDELESKPAYKDKQWAVDFDIYHADSDLTEAELQDFTDKLRTALTANGNRACVELEDCVIGIYGDDGGDNDTVDKIIAEMQSRGCWLEYPENEKARLC